MDMTAPGQAAQQVGTTPSPDGGRSAGIPVWVVILAAATIAAIGMGLRQVMGLYLKPVSDTLGVGREAFALAIAISNIVWGISAPITGAISDKYGTGRVAIFGAVTTIIGLLVLATAATEFDLLISGVFLGFGVAGCGVNAMVGAVARRVPAAERTSAIAAIGMGSGAGILIALPYTHLLMQGLGWQQSLFVLAATAATILVLARAVSGKPQVAAGESTQSLGEALGEAFKHPSFWLLNAGFFVCGFHVVFYGTHLPAYIADKGLPPNVAVLGLTAVGLGNLIGTYLSGQWGRRLPKKYGLVLIYLGRSAVFLGFLFLPWTLLGYIVMYQVGPNGVEGFEWFIVGFAFVVDIASYMKASQSREN